MSENFAELLRLARSKKKLSMLGAAELAGIALPIYKMIERGRIFPDREKLDALCEAFDFTWPADVSNDHLDG